MFPRQCDRRASTNWFAGEVDGALEIRMGLAIDFHPAANNQVRTIFGFWLEIEIASFRPFETILVESAEPLRGFVRRGGIRRRNIERNPADARRKKIRPAAIAGVVVLARVLRLEPAAVEKATRDTSRTAERDKRAC